MSNFCVQPFFGIYDNCNLKENENLCCCLLPKDTDTESLREEFKKGIKPTACNKCWDQEQKGITSKRLLDNQLLDYKLDKDISSIEQDAYNGKFSTLMYQFGRSNLCNGACVTCWSGASTSWAKFEKEMGIKPRKFAQMDEIEIDYINAKSFTFTGGEPLYDKKIFDILELLVEAGNTDCFISFVTNGSTDIDNKRQQLLSKFTDINFCLSIDGIEKTFEYIRYPLKWDTLLKNLEFFRSITNNISVSFTLSNLSNMYKKQTIEWFEKEKLPYFINSVQKPDHFSPDVVPGHKLWSNFVKRIKLQDKAKNIYIKDYLPEFNDLINQGEIDVQSI